ncbi:hypothetical protein F5Y04DRAFT_293009 [Hypomontagnella monticulosa]|nr:hypothetical protein F5Y04DRAFT_293009 [Hypomontagnella monticulosa]
MDGIRPRHQGRDTSFGFGQLFAAGAVLVVAVLAFGGNYLPGVNIPVPHQTLDKDFNITTAMDKYWKASLSLLPESHGFESWFDNADTNTATIANMLEAIPLAGSPVKRKHLHGSDNDNIPELHINTKERLRSLESAKKEFELFINTRSQIVRSMVSDETFWHWLVESGKDMEYILFLARQARTQMIPIDESKSHAEHDAIMQRHTKKIALELVTAINSWWNQNGNGEALQQHLQNTLQYITDAQAHEKSAIVFLRLFSRKFDIWGDKYHCSYLVLGQLQRKIESLHNRTIDARQTLGQVTLAKDPPDVANKSHEEATTYWAMVIEDLLKKWVSAMEGLQEGVMFSLRRKDLEMVENIAEFDFDTSWEGWKRRNCGGTSCYDPAITLTKLLTQLGYTGKPLAGAALDEKSKEYYTKFMTTKPKGWRGTYDKICCSDDARFINFFKYGPVTTIKKFKDARAKSTA